MDLKALQRRLAYLGMGLDHILLVMCIGLLCAIFFSVFTGVVIGTSSTCLGRGPRRSPDSA